MTAPPVQLFGDFPALREAVRQQGLDPDALAAQDLFSTLVWFENLACHGLAKGASEASAPLLLLTREPATGDWAGLALQERQGGLHSLSNYYSSLYGPLHWPQSRSSPSTNPWPQVCQQLATYLQTQRHRWPVITLQPLDKDSAFFKALQTALTQAGYWVDSFFCFGNWFLKVAGRSANTYFDTLPPALRHSLARGQRRLTRQGRWEIRLHTAPHPALEAAIADFVQVYQHSWKSPEPHPDFIPALIRLAAHQGWLRLGILSLDAQAIAAQLWLVKDGVASIYKLAYVSGFERFSAGSLLTQALMRQVIDVDQVQEVDYLTGDDAYKQDWMSHRRERWGVVAFHPATLRGRWAGWQHRVGRWLHRWRHPPGT